MRLPWTRVPIPHPECEVCTHARKTYKIAEHKFSDKSRKHNDETAYVGERGGSPRTF